MITIITTTTNNNKYATTTNNNNNNNNNNHKLRHELPEEPDVVHHLLVRLLRGLLAPGFCWADIYIYIYIYI